MVWRNMRKKTILVVEDDSDVMAFLVEDIRSFGYDVVEAPDAETALSMFQEAKAIDLVITDMHLPGMSGIDLLGEVKRASQAVPVIMLTGHSSIESYVQTISSGVFEYINKPVQAEELERIIKAALTQPSAGAGSVPLDA